MTGPDPLAAWAGLAPTRVQLAADGAWEHPLVPSGDDDHAGWLGGHEDVALEVFFTSRIFLGVRLTAVPAGTRVRFLRELRAALARPGASLGGAATFWRLPDGTPLLPGGLPRTLEAGVVDAWLSTGSAVIWRAGEDRPDHGRLTEALRRTRDRPVALEAAYDGPAPTWIGREVSAPAGAGLFRLDEAELDRAAADFLGRPARLR